MPYETTHITDRQSLAAKKHVGAKLRNVGIKGDIREFDVREADWSDLNKAQKRLVTVSRELLDRIGDNTPDDENREIETAHDGLMGLYDAIEQEKDLRTGKMEPAPVMPDKVCRPDGGGMGAVAPEESRVLAPEQRFADYLSKGTREYAGLGVGNYLRAMVVGPSNDSERRALAEGSDSTGGFTVPTELSGQLVDLLRSQNVAIRAGARTVPLTSDNLTIAKIASDPQPAWRGENTSIGEGDPTFSSVVFEPKSLAVIVRVSRELLQDSVNINADLPRMLAAAMAQELDRVVFLGSGSGNEPSGLDNITGVQSVAHDAAIADYTPLTKARRALMNSNIPTVSGYVMHPDVEADFGDLTDSNGQPLNHPGILDRPEPLRMLTTTKLPTNLGTGTNEGVIYAGDYSMLAIGMRSEVRVEVLRERYADMHQFGFVAHMRADVAAIHPEAFVRVTGVQV